MVKNEGHHWFQRVYEGMLSLHRVPALKAWHDIDWFEVNPPAAGIPNRRSDALHGMEYYLLTFSVS